MASPGADEIQLDLFDDYRSNIALYPTFQEYFRAHQPPFLAVWGKNHPYFLRRVQSRSSAITLTRLSASLTLATSALETHACEIAESIRDIMK